MIEKPKIKVLYKSVLYTDYYSEYILYKHKRYKLTTERISSGRITAHIYLITDTNKVDIAYESDLYFNTNDYYISSSEKLDKDNCHKLMLARIEQCKEFIMKVF